MTTALNVHYFIIDLFHARTAHIYPQSTWTADYCIMQISTQLLFLHKKPQKALLSCLALSQREALYTVDIPQKKNIFVVCSVFGLLRPVQIVVQLVQLLENKQKMHVHERCAVVRFFLLLRKISH
jgi:hypothetical protein